MSAGAAVHIAPRREPGLARAGSKLKAYYQALVSKLERAGQSQLENYLAASQSLADLEERIRIYERRQSKFL